MFVLGAVATTFIGDLVEAGLGHAYIQQWVHVCSSRPAGNGVFTLPISPWLVIPVVSLTYPTCHQWEFVGCMVTCALRMLVHFQSDG